MTALELLQAEMAIVCSESEGRPWQLDPAPGSSRLAPHYGVMTPGRMRARLLRLVDEYSRDGSLPPDEERIVRDAIELAIDRVRRWLEERVSWHAARDF